MLVVLYMLEGEADGRGVVVRGFRTSTFHSHLAFCDEVIL